MWEPFGLYLTPFVCKFKMIIKSLKRKENEKQQHRFLERDSLRETEKKTPWEDETKRDINNCFLF